MILANAWIVTMDDAGTEYEHGWLRIENGLIAELGAGEPPAAAAAPPPRVGSEPPATRQDRHPPDGVRATRPSQQISESLLDLGGAVVTPGLVNTHHHLYQTLTRARAQEADLFTWLKTLYPVWARLDDEMEHAAALCGLAELALSGCSTPSSTTITCTSRSPIRTASLRARSERLT